MTLNDWLLLFAALIPAIVLCIYVFKKDRVEKEPVGLLLGLAALGAFTCFPASFLEEILLNLINAVFTPFAVEQDGQLYLDGILYYLYHGSKYFIGVALVEEFVKWAVLLLVTRNNKNFNSLFDGVIYAVFVSLGFAALENVMYVFEYGWLNALMRALTSVPGHMFFGVLMGYYYSFWHVCKTAAQKEDMLKAHGLIGKNVRTISGSRYLCLSLLMPVLSHGLYDYCCTLDSGLATVVFYGFLIFLYIYCFGKIKKMSRVDAMEDNFAAKMLALKYPSLFNQQSAGAISGDDSEELIESTMQEQI